jgi:hypothetical protein
MKHLKNNENINESSGFIMFRNDADVVESMKYLKRFSEINESLPRQHTVDQLKRLRKLTKGTDIGDRISDMNKEGALLIPVLNHMKIMKKLIRNLYHLGT